MRVLRLREEIEPLRGEWERLAGHPDQNWDLYWSAIRAQSPAPSPYVVAVPGDGRLEAVLAGRVESGTVALQLGYWKPLRVPVRRIVVPTNGLLGRSDEATARSLVEALVEDLREGRADVALFHFLEEGSPLHRAARSVPVGFRMRDRVPERRVHRYLHLPRTFEEYHRGHKGLMQKVRKFERAFEDRYEYRLLTREDEVEAFRLGADAVVCRTYQRALGVGFLDSAEDRARLEAVARQGLWRAFVALVDGKTAAFWCGCQSGESVSLWWTGYDTSLQEYSPGLVSSTRMVEQLIARGVTLVDFGGGDAPYKERLAEAARWEESVCLFAPSLRGSLAHGVRAVDAALGNLTRTRLKGLASRVKTPWRRLMARRMAEKASHRSPEE